METVAEGGVTGGSKRTPIVFALLVMLFTETSSARTPAWLAAQIRNSAVIVRHRMMEVFSMVLSGMIGCCKAHDPTTDRRSDWATDPENGYGLSTLVARDVDC